MGSKIFIFFYKILLLPNPNTYWKLFFWKKIQFKEYFIYPILKVSELKGSSRVNEIFISPVYISN